MLNEHDLKEFYEEQDRKLREAYQQKQSFLTRQVEFIRNFFYLLGLK